MDSLTELFHQFQVGKFYRVPTVKTTDTHRPMGYVPIIGPLHTDAEIIQFPHEHWHIDWRFAPKALWDYAAFGPWRDNSHCYAVVQQPRAVPSWGHKVLIDEEYGVQPRRMKCKREFPAYPYSKAKWFTELKAKFAGCKLKPGLICPHKGVPVVGPKEGDIATCPGHGLRWNVVTGEIVA